LYFLNGPVFGEYYKTTPLITQESMEIGQAWDKKMGEDFIEKMKDKGY
jgi:hypothetical protein